MIGRITFALGLVAMSTGPALAEPTQVTVRAISRDAKYIGDSMGGVRVTLRDAASGRELASGVIRGATGDTQKIIVAPRARHEPISTPEAAAFRATLDLDRPTLVKAEAVGPLGKPDAQVTVTSMMWLLPGQTLNGDGWTLEFPGLVVEPAWTTRNGQIEVSAKVTLMCGCPIEPGGHWDANAYRVRATLLEGDRTVETAELAYAGKPSSFAGRLKAQPGGGHRLLVTAINPQTGNVGVVERTLDVTH